MFAVHLYSCAIIELPQVAEVSVKEVAEWQEVQVRTNKRHMR